MVQLSEPAQGIAMINQGIQSARATGSEMFQSHLLGLLDDALLRKRPLWSGALAGESTGTPPRSLLQAAVA